MRVKKGVYMDGHERPDIAEYRKNKFLPLMVLFKRCMVHWKPEGTDLVHVELDLGPEEKRVITVFQNECCFHANNNKQTVWCAPCCQSSCCFHSHSKRSKDGDQRLMKKGQGQLIHISDFVEEENGCLIVCNQEGIVVKDTRCITYPGTGGDQWWDHVQLLAQVNWAIKIFKEVHPKCVALFLFNHSSTHASLGPDALHAFEMNKGNGGKQRKQKDTVVSINNPTVECHGKPQKMTTKAGKPKGLQQMLGEWGFDIYRMRLKCSPVCPFENNDCCMAQLLSKQDDF